MAKRLIIASILGCCLLTTTGFVLAQPSESSQDAIAEGCKSYLEQFNGNTDPDKLPASAQTALKACRNNGSCASAALSHVPDCAMKLEQLQPNQGAALTVQSPAKPPALPNAPSSLWHIGTQPAPTQNAPASAPISSPTPTTDENVETPPPPPANTNQPLGVTPEEQPKKTQPSINWF